MQKCGNWMNLSLLMEEDIINPHSNDIMRSLQSMRKSWKNILKRYRSAVKKETVIQKQIILPLSCALKQITWEMISFFQPTMYRLELLTNILQ